MNATTSWPAVSCALFPLVSDVSADTETLASADDPKPLSSSLEFRLQGERSDEVSVNSVSLDIRAADTNGVHGKASQKLKRWKRIAGRTSMLEGVGSRYTMWTRADLFHVV